MSKILVVAWREFKHTALTKAFIIGTLVVPLLIWGGMILVPLFVAPGVSSLEGTVAILDPTGRLEPALRVELQARGAVPRTLDVNELGDLDPDELKDRLTDATDARGPFSSTVHMELTTAGFDDPNAAESLREDVRSGRFVALAVVDESYLTDPEGTRGRGPRFRLFVPDDANPDHVTAIRRALGQAVVRARADHAGLDVEEVRALLRPPVFNTRRLTDVGEAAAGIELQKILPIAFMILLWVAAFGSGNYLLTTTIEEKSNKVMEVLLSAISPMQLMTGKIIGQAIVGLVTVSVYATLGFALLWYFAMADLISPVQVLYLVLFFFMAYFMVASIMAGIGSVVSDLQEAHALLTPAILILMIPMVLFMPVSQNPNGALATVTTFIPPLTPFVMIIRVTASETPPVWQTIAAILVGTIGVVVMVWMCARIFRIGVLMQGKPPSPLELLRWLRYS